MTLADWLDEAASAPDRAAPLVVRKRHTDKTLALSPRPLKTLCEDRRYRLMSDQPR